jgi:5-methylcytosine-specific restriction enzyme A
MHAAGRRCSHMTGARDRAQPHGHSRTGRGSATHVIGGLDRAPTVERVRAARPDRPCRCNSVNVVRSRSESARIVGVALIGDVTAEVSLKVGHRLCPRVHATKKRHRIVVRDRRYNTQAWRRLRQAILIRDGHTCQVGGPRCVIVATTVHHILPSSQHPERFWDPTNLEAACAPCNAHGGAVAHENSVNRARSVTLSGRLSRCGPSLTSYGPGKPAESRRDHGFTSQATRDRREGADTRAGGRGDSEAIACRLADGQRRQFWLLTEGGRRSGPPPQFKVGRRAGSSGRPCSRRR